MALEHEAIGTSVFVRCTDGICISGADPAMTDSSPEELATEHAERPTSPLVSIQLFDEDSAIHNKMLVREAAAAMRAKGGEGSVIRFKIWLWEEDFDFSQFRTTTRNTTARNALVESRRRLNAPLQEMMEHAVESHGGRVITRRWVTNSLLVDVPLDGVDAVLDNPLVFGAYLAGETAPTEAGDGLERRDSFNPLGILQDGETGGSAGSQIIAAVIEARFAGSANPLNTTHQGWQDTAGGPSRVLSARSCGPSSCDANGGAASTSTHGTEVASILAGSIQQGQVAAFPGTNTIAQKRRSGIVSEAMVRYYTVNSTSTDDMETALETALADGVDLANNSWGVSGATGCENLCSLSFDPSGIKADLTAMENAGIILVAAAGNAGSCGLICSTNFPAVNPDVIAVAALNDTAGSTFEDVDIAAFSSRGQLGTTLFGGTISSLPTIGLISFGFVRLMFGSGTSGFFPSFDFGTSFASPGGRLFGWCISTMDE